MQTEESEFKLGSLELNGKGLSLSQKSQNHLFVLTVIVASIFSCRLHHLERDDEVRRARTCKFLYGHGLIATMACMGATIFSTNKNRAKR